QHFVLGYFHWVPPGRLLRAHIPSPYVGAALRPGGWVNVLQRDRSCERRSTVSIVPSLSQTLII
ncbi:MAG: hypothetical protein WB696_17265, partial [Chthoniobacterales bacterium]